MEIFVWTNFVMAVGFSLLGLFYVAVIPPKPGKNYGSDVIQILFCIGWAIWAWAVLHQGG